jgi:hypothetical protein
MNKLENDDKGEEKKEKARKQLDKIENIINALSDSYCEKHIE